MAGLDRDALTDAVRRVAARLEGAAAELNALDAQLGDGDLGGTLGAVAAALKPKVDTFPEDVGGCFMAIAQAIGATSGSSFAALSMFGVMKLAGGTKGRTDVPWAELPGLIDEAVATMSARGGASLGDKTVLDGLAAISTALRDAGNGADRAGIARQAVADTLDRFRDQRSKIGRARIAGDRSVGTDDPGMRALYIAVESLAG
jgi:dihydroxyacetone kinase-like protein